MAVGDGDLPDLLGWEEGRWWPAWWWRRGPATAVGDRGGRAAAGCPGRSRGSTGVRGGRAAARVSGEVARRHRGWEGRTAAPGEGGSGAGQEVGRDGVGGGFLFLFFYRGVREHLVASI